jgi:tetratricopeptide (TPR) repeat protein
MTKKSLIISGTSLAALVMCAGCASTSYTDSKGNPVPSQAANAFNSGLKEDNAGKCEEAIADYTRAIALDPNLEDAYNNRGICLFDLGKYDDAVADCNKAIELDPNYVNPYFVRGQALDELGKYADAIKDYNQVLKLDPNNADQLNKDARESLEECQKELSGQGQPK